MCSLVMILCSRDLLVMSLSTITIRTLNSSRLAVRGVGIGPAGPVLAGPLFLKVKTNFHFTELKQVINRSASVIFGLVRLIILCYNR